MFAPMVTAGNTCVMPAPGTLPNSRLVCSVEKRAVLTHLLLSTELNATLYL